MTIVNVFVFTVIWGSHSTHAFRSFRCCVITIFFLKIRSPQTPSPPPPPPSHPKVRRFPYVYGLYRELKQRRFWAADVNRKFMFLLLALFHAPPMSYKALILAFTTWIFEWKSRLPVDVRGSKTPVLKLPTSNSKPTPKETSLNSTQRHLDKPAKHIIARHFLAQDSQSQIRHSRGSRTCEM